MKFWVVNVLIIHDTIQVTTLILHAVIIRFVVITPRTDSSIITN